MRILFVGDIVGSPGRNAFFAMLPKLRRLKGPFDFVLVNGENSAAGRGITGKIMNEFFAAGVDGITSGNHIWDKKEFLPLLDEEPRVLRPLNYPQGVPGRGWTILTNKNGKKLGVVNIQGRVFMPLTDCPFHAMGELLSKLGDIPVFVDFHAEATSEKRVMGLYLDGRVSAIVGTHTHVQTADEEILPGGTAYISDVGMTGAFRSSIGMTYESVLPRFLTSLPAKFEVAEEDVRLNGVIVEIDDEDGRACGIERLAIRSGELGERDNEN
ncbi:TIGR00282 family metallophosphoesterase [Pyramidobacter piscolens]|uniref:TIGR00282 family metallophosphoesterase n=1 Tax=Pyramidobacter piscolens TaxID=638849 RepID=UPI001FCCB339|nr:TIGR00282 family metallophosphoesterase [Pyramidobacter piscolens]BDF79143.1 2',3'-cyclic-nucleotide 2'-phosphodiesterase [Pyramidobacter piscolens]